MTRPGVFVLRPSLEGAAVQPGPNRPILACDVSQIRSTRRKRQRPPPSRLLARAVLTAVGVRMRVSPLPVGVLVLSFQLRVIAKVAMLFGEPGMVGLVFSIVPDVIVLVSPVVHPSPGRLV